MTRLSVDRLCVGYGHTPVLDALSFEVSPGEVLGLVGESGSGKSTAALAIARLLPANARVSGRIVLDGEDLLALRPRAMEAMRGRRIGFVFQEPMAALNPLMRVGAQVAEACGAHGAGAGAGGAATALARVGLADMGDRYPHQLSGGQRQRVAIAIAAALKRSLIIADEPTTALDPRAQAHILRLLTGIAREDGAALLLVTHDLAVVAQYADRIAVLDGGRLVETGPVLRLRSPRHPVTRALVDAFTPPPAVPHAPPGETVLEALALTRDHARPRAHPLDRPPAFRALDAVSLRLARGERLGIVGASGSGKSTLLRLLLGLDTPTSGEVRLAGEVLTPDAPARLRRLIQPVFQDPAGSFDPRWRVARVVAEPLRLTDLDASARAGRVADALARVGLAAELAARLPHQLSGGQRQRVAIARALVVQPAIVALDEAVSALDPRVRATVLALLDRLGRELGLALLFVSHDLGVIAQATDRLIVLDQGRIVEEGATSAVLAAPAHPATRALIDNTPSLERALRLRDTDGNAHAFPR